MLYCAVRVISDRAYDTGDVNGDGDITLADATLTLTYYAEEAVSGHPQFSDMIVCDEASAFLLPMWIRIAPLPYQTLR